MASTSISDNSESVWLVEPQRTKTVIKFSGTMQHPSTNDKRGITIAAFTHFVFESSGRKLVFADIQGKFKVEVLHPKLSALSSFRLTDDCEWTGRDCSI